MMPDHLQSLAIKLAEAGNRRSSAYLKAAGTSAPPSDLSVFVEAQEDFLEAQDQFLSASKWWIDCGRPSETLEIVEEFEEAS